MSVDITRHTIDFATAPQMRPENMAALAAMGFQTVINNRPDGEGGPDQPTSQALAAAAAAAGLAYHYLPITPGQMTPAQVQQFVALLRTEKNPVLAFCRSGTRSTHLWQLGL